MRRIVLVLCALAAAAVRTSYAIPVNANTLSLNSGSVSGTGDFFNSNGYAGTYISADGMVDAPDYDAWASKFGNVYGSGAGTAAAVPKPRTLSLFAFGTLSLVVRQRRRRTQARSFTG